MASLKISVRRNARGGSYWPHLTVFGGSNHFRICGLSSLKGGNTISLLFRRQCLTFMVASLMSIHLSAAVWKTHCHRISLTANGVFPVRRLAMQQRSTLIGLLFNAVNENSSPLVSLQDSPGRCRHLLLVLCPLAAKDGKRRRWAWPKCIHGTPPDKRHKNAWKNAKFLHVLSLKAHWCTSSWATKPSGCPENSPLPAPSPCRTSEVRPFWLF